MYENTIIPVCECGNDEDFQLKDMRYIVRHIEVDKDILGNPVYKNRGSLCITVKCPACDRIHRVYVNRLDYNQFKPGEEPNIQF